MRLLRACAPLLEQGYDPAVVLVASKNVPAPGPGAAAYSAAKAGLTQLGRVAALELGGKGIRVNTLHPDAVYDTALWSEDILAQRAEANKTKNLLATEVSSTDVAEAVFLFAGTRLAKSTGVQLPVDGGNERVV
jgi:NAD(P)-dependent dehydrogenase (short-subunit alcohol dehydrogenase family)